jgi:hypothetical protein
MISPRLNLGTFCVQLFEETVKTNVITSYTMKPFCINLGEGFALLFGFIHPYCQYNVH